jgi:hypothetical protein
MSIENKSGSAAVEDQVIEQTLEERIKELEERKEHIKFWGEKTGRISREDAEEIDKIEARLKELRGQQ